MDGPDHRERRYRLLAHRIVCFRRRYVRNKTPGDRGKTENSTSFGKNNLLLLSLMAARCFEWIAAQQRA